MRFCPICTQTFSREFNRCPQCAVNLAEEPEDFGDASLLDGLEVAWSLSHVAAEVNRLCALLAEEGISVSVAERDIVFPWPRWKEMSGSLSFPNDVRNVRLLVDAERVEEAQRIVEEAQRIIEEPSDESLFDEDRPDEIDDELEEADWRYDEPAQEIGDMGGPPLAGR